jgi:hypothetical protein
MGFRGAHNCLRVLVVHFCVSAKAEGHTAGFWLLQVKGCCATVW